MTRHTISAMLFIPIAVLLAARLAAEPPSTEPAHPPAVDVQAVQGRGHRSPFEGKRVERVNGVVTAVLSGGRIPGFWIQNPKGDGDDATSDALFVSTKGVLLEVAVGELVLVSGTVEEPGQPGALTTTQIARPEVQIESHGNALPKPVRIGLGGRSIPDRIIDDDSMRSFDVRTDAIDFWESLEGMRVELRDPVVVGPTSAYGDMVVLADRGRGAKVRSARGGIVIQEHDFNPERIVIEPRLVPKPPVVNVGDRFDGSLTAIVDHGFGNFRLLNTAPLPPPVAGSRPPEVTDLRGDATHLTIATYNVLNLSAVSSDEKFRRVAASIVSNLKAPDVIALEEMQDDSGPADDGVVSAAKTFGKLIDAITAAGGPRYEYCEIDPLNNQDGGQPGGNIRVGFLFDPRRVAVVARGKGSAQDPTSVEGGGRDTRLTLSPGRIDPLNPCFAGGGSGELAEPTRKSLVAELRIGERTVFLIVNHLKSKRGDEPLFGANQPPVLKTEEQRNCQAEIVGHFAAGILARDPGAAVVVVGDLNEHEFRRPLRTLAETSGLTNLIERVPTAERYTFVFEGNAQVLDHILVSPALLRDASPEIDIVHANADFTESAAASDHDPVLVRLRM